MKTFKLFVLFVLVSNVLKAQSFDSTFFHSSKAFAEFDKKKEPIGLIWLQDNDGKLTEIQTRCNCQKNVKENQLAIQISKTFPSKSYKNKYLKESISLANRFMMNYSWYTDSLDFQTTQITIYLTNDKIDSAVIKRASQEAQFDGEHKLNGEINYFNVQITKTDYHIASDIWGVAKLKMPIPFGWTGKDNIVNVYFRCNNSKIEKTLEIPEFDDGH